MHNAPILLVIAFLKVFTLTLSSAQPAAVQQKANEQEVLSPLTEEERLLNARDLLLNQPDFMADLSFFVAHRVSGHGFSQRLVRKGNRYREESEFWIFVGELGKPSARLFPKTKVYDDYVPPHGGSLHNPPIDTAAVAREDDITFTALGTVVIDGHNCIKIEARRKTTPDKYYFYLARDLKNLAIVTQLVQPNRNTVQRLTNISLEVPDSLVHIPPDYKQIEHDRWTKVENAIVTYKRKPAKDATVFRSPGGHLFIRVNDWTYLVRPAEATVETAFQGLLVTRTGQFVWETSDTEAYSSIQYKKPHPPSKWESAYDRRVTVTPNSVTFRATDYERSKAIIEIRW
jgi:hypothetical protein